MKEKLNVFFCHAYSAFGRIYLREKKIVLVKPNLNLIQSIPWNLNFSDIWSLWITERIDDPFLNRRKVGFFPKRKRYDRLLSAIAPQRTFTVHSLLTDRLLSFNLRARRIKPETIDQISVLNKTSKIPKIPLILKNHKLPTKPCRNRNHR